MTAGKKRPEDDYGPEWYPVAEMEQGGCEDTGSVFDVRRLDGSVRDRQWELRPAVTSRRQPVTTCPRAWPDARRALGVSHSLRYRSTIPIATNVANMAA